MIWDGLRGRDDQREMFRRSIGRGRLASAYLLAGPEGSGKALFVRKLAQCLFCSRIPDEQLDACGECSNCRQMQAGSHPDFIQVSCPEGKNEIPLELFLGDREKRGREGFCYQLSIRPMSATRKVGLIDGADRMNDEGANAILKTLEEPPPYAIMILTASNGDSLLPTIRSRCQLIRFPPLSEDDVAAILQEQQWVESAEEASVIAGMSDGSLATARQLLDPRLRHLRDRFFSGLSDPRFSSVALAKELVGGLEELGSDAPTQRRGAIWMLRFGMEFCRQLLRELASPGQTSGVSTEVLATRQRLRDDSTNDYERVMEMFDRISAARDQIELPMPVPLCMEGLCDDLGRILRRA